MIRSTIYISLIILISSCASTDQFVVSKIKKGTELAKAEFKAAGAGQNLILQYYNLKNDEWAIVKIENNLLEILPLRKDMSKHEVTNEKYTSVVPHDIKKRTNYYIPYEFEYNSLMDKLRNGSIKVPPEVNPPFTNAPLTEEKFKEHFKIGSKFTYRLNKFSMKAITIPFKFRLSVDGKGTRLSTSANVGFGPTWQFTKKTYQPIGSDLTINPSGYHETKFESSISPFIGLTAIDLTKDNTRIEVENDKKVLGVTGGVLYTIDINSVDLGIALGLDNLLVKNSNDWIYQRSIWFGLGVGLDIIK